MLLGFSSASEAALTGRVASRGQHGVETCPGPHPRSHKLQVLVAVAGYISLPELANGRHTIMRVQLGAQPIETTGAWGLSVRVRCGRSLDHGCSSCWGCDEKCP